jgi:hypothetical protein
LEAFEVVTGPKKNRRSIGFVAERTGVWTVIKGPGPDDCERYRKAIWMPLPSPARSPFGEMPCPGIKEAVDVLASIDMERGFIGSPPPLDRAVLDAMPSASVPVFDTSGLG